MTRSKGKDAWYIPGGKREAGETDEQALRRELKEELNADIIPETIRSYGVFEVRAHGKADGIMVRMTYYDADFAGKPEATSEIEEVAYFVYADKLRIGPVNRLILDLILDDLKADNLID